jgi:hypothetical protein
MNNDLKKKITRARKSVDRLKNKLSVLDRLEKEYKEKELKYGQ